MQIKLFSFEIQSFVDINILIESYFFLEIKRNLYFTANCSIFYKEDKKAN